MSEDLEEEAITSATEDASVLVIDVDEMVSKDSKRAKVKEVVDLTKGYGPLLVDLTADDSPVVVRTSGSRRNQNRKQNADDNKTVCSNDCPEEDLLEASLSSPGKSPERNLTCPICMDDAKQIFRRQKRLVSTICGHVFCEGCLKEALKMQNKCPKCRRKLTSKQFHPLYL